MRKLIFAALTFLAGQCSAGVSYTPKFGFAEPTSGTVNWAGYINGNWDILDLYAPKLDVANVFTNSITATKYYGNGSSLTGILSTGTLLSGDVNGYYNGLVISTITSGHFQMGNYPNIGFMVHGSSVAINNSVFSPTQKLLVNGGIYQASLTEKNAFSSYTGFGTNDPIVQLDVNGSVRVIGGVVNIATAAPHSFFVSQSTPIFAYGLRAGAGFTTGGVISESAGVDVIGPDGRIPALTSTYIANLDGSALTNLPVDSSKVSKGGDTLTGTLIFEPTSISTGNIIFQGGYPHSIKFDNHSGATNQFLGEVDFLQNGTGRHRIIGYGDTHSTQPKGLYIGATTTGAGTNIRLSGSVSENPDLVISSWTSVGLNTASPNSAYVLDANGHINSTGYYLNGVPFTGGSGSGSTVTVNTSQMSGDGSQSAPITLLASSVTLQGNLYSIAGIAASTGVIQSSLSSVIVSTGAIYSALNSTAAALTAEISRAISRENAIGASTGTIQTSLSAVILSTAPLKDYANWNTAYGWGNHATAGYANASAVGTATATLRTDLTSVATSTGAIYSALNSTAAALTAEISRATARENAIGASTGTIYAALNSTAAALTSEISRATTRENAIAASTGAIYNTAMFLASTQTVTGYNVHTSSTLFTGPVIAQTRLYYANGIPKDYNADTKYPGWAYSGTGGGGYTTNVNNIKVADNVYATSTGSYTGGSYVNLAIGTLGFSIPSTATILGVQVGVGRYQESGGTANDTLCLMINSVQSNYCKASGTIPTTRVDPTYGGNGDLWNTSPYGDAPLTPAIVNATGFGVVDGIIWQSGQVGAKAVYTDYYVVTVWYTADDYFSSGYDLAATSSSFNVKWKQNTIMSVSSASIVYAAGFAGDGSRLTNLGSATDNTKVLKTGDTMTGPLTLNGSSLTVNGVAQTTSFITGVSTFTGNVYGVSLSEIEDLTANKVFTMGNKTLEWQFVDPTGGMKFDFTGAADGHALEIKQETGNPGTGMHLLHVEATDADPTLVHLRGANTSSEALMLDVSGDTNDRLSVKSSGLMEWGPGNAAVDTNLYRASASVLKTDDSFVAIGSVTANTYYGDGSNLTGVSGGGTPIFQYQNFYSSTNGTNKVFQLSSAPVNNSLILTKNGVAMVAPDDYTLYTDSITMVSAPVSSTTLAARYVVGYSSLTIANVTGTNNNWTGSNSFATPPTGVTNSSYTMITAGTTHAVTTFACLAGSTITITTAGNTRVLVGLTAGVAVSAAMSPITGYLVDGQDVNGQSATAGRIQVSAGTASWWYNASFTDVTPVLSAGSHTFCAKIRADTGGTITIGSSISKPSFWVQELR